MPPTTPPATPPTVPQYENTLRPTSREDDKVTEYGLGLKDEEHAHQKGITKVEEVDLSAYHYTEEESKSVVRKFDWHVCGPYFDQVKWLIRTDSPVYMVYVDQRDVLG